MAKILTARLDEKTQKELARLSKSLDKTESEIVRESIHIMALTYLAASPGRPGFIGMGKFDSGIKDLASNKNHLGDFGR